MQTFYFLHFWTSPGFTVILIPVAIISDLLEVYKEYIPIFNLWADAESKLADPLHAMANAFDKNSSALKTLVRVFSKRALYHRMTKY